MASGPASGPHLTQSGWPCGGRDRNGRAGKRVRPRRAGRPSGPGFAKAGAITGTCGKKFSPETIQLRFALTPLPIYTWQQVRADQVSRAALTSPQLCPPWCCSETPHEAKGETARLDLWGFSRCATRSSPRPLFSAARSTYPLPAMARAKATKSSLSSL